MSGLIQTVLGRIEPSQLGSTLMHEHVFSDVSWAKQPPDDPRWVTVSREPVRPGNLWWVRRRPISGGDNMRLTDLALAVEELQHYAAAGGAGLVELTVRGIGPRPALLAHLASLVPIHIVSGTGYYMHRTRPLYWGRATAEEIAYAMARDVIEGFTHAPGVRAGIIGELALEGPDSIGVKQAADLGDSDLKLLRAAAIAQAASGAAVSIHLPHSLAAGASPAELALGVVDLLESAGTDLRRVILGHVDRARGWSIDQLVSLASRGIVLEFDEWGLEGYLDDSDHVNPLDEERIEWTLGLAHAGYLTQLVWSHDVYLKSMLRKHGGTGYVHINDFVIPRALKRGLRDRDVKTIMVSNPRRLLALAAPTTKLDDLPRTLAGKDADVEPSPGMR